MGKVTQALILAAGRGMRMGRRGEDIPKGFITLGGETLVARSLALLAGAGIRHVTIVTGHLAGFYERLAPPAGLSLGLRHNPLFAQRGSFESLRVGLAAMRGDFRQPDSTLLRLMQNNPDHYGQGHHTMRITTLTPTDFAEEFISPIDFTHHRTQAGPLTATDIRDRHR